MPWKCSRIKVKNGVILEEKYRDKTRLWTTPHKNALEAHRLKKSQWYYSEEGWDYFYVMYQISKEPKKLRGNRYVEYKEQYRKPSKVKQKRDNSSPYRSRVKRSKAKEEMLRVREISTL